MKFSVINILKKEWFLACMVVAIVLAALIPQVGQSDGILHLNKVTDIGIALVFFLHGIGLSPQALKNGVSNWKLHLFVQCATFVIYPMLWVIFGQGMLSIMPHALAFGFCFLFVLPSTISSSVAMTAIGKGNIPGAIFNASLSSILGIVITPLLIQLFMGFEGVQLDIMSSVMSISKMLLLPMIIGQVLRPLLLSTFEKHKNIVNKLDKYVILLIVFNAFSDSVSEGVWHSFSFEYVAMSVLICSVVLVSIVQLMVWTTKRLGFSHADEVAAVFCGSKKTLAAGIPMAKVIFGSDPRLGMILLPIMIYHPLQIFYCAVLANRYQKKAFAI
ncbi:MULTISPECIES: bile acid:sodium symporter family protein [Vibrio]|uniref:Bile acid:sodium symporter n=1 Tax=Vibrio casei TaxID=673372 RepID=A0A368LPY7_9VIBR|nr:MULTISPECIES: bile acid:sodium symporter family protein [Vibrio]RCS73942.1 bile acid:sodium symporter [Vibrio casei]SJN32038.1 Sodium/bile acid symporter family [Vibrio casei]HBV77129.1 bile acid:sodium symporter [Vibrio sp.]